MSLPLRKSTRVRTLTDKVRPAPAPATNTNPAPSSNPASPSSNLASPTFNSAPTNVKRRKLNSVSSVSSDIKDDKIDPVEKLLSLTTFNNDILMNMDEKSSSDPHQHHHRHSHSPSTLDSDSSCESCESDSDSDSDSEDDSPKPNHLSLNFTKIINDNLRSYYSRIKRCPIEIYNDNSSFALLNKDHHLSHQHKSYNCTDCPAAAPPISSAASTQSQDVPFFRNVNFNPKPHSAYTLDQYLAYDEDDEDEDDPKSSSSSSAVTTANTSPILPNNTKMSFRYRHHDNLNLSLNNTTNDDPQDVFKILNKNSILTGKASEMMSTGNFLINDFFL